jgi:hypothetical protein
LHKISIGKFSNVFLNRFNYYKMKKLVLFVVIVVAVALSACKKEASVPSTDETPIETPATPVEEAPAAPAEEVPAAPAEETPAQ